MKYRPQRGSLEESMKEVVDLEPTIEAIAKHLNVEVACVTVTPYVFDERIGWYTSIVTVNGDAVGFTNKLFY